MAGSTAVKIACMMVVCMVVAAPLAEAITCSSVVSGLLPCVPYLTRGGQPSPACCSGVRALNARAKSTPDRQTACGCLKSAYNAFKVVGGYASSLPGKCGVNIPYKISPSTDCSKVK